MAATLTRKTALPVVLGTATFGKAGTEQISVSDPTVVEDLLATFAAHGHDALDASRFYGGGSTEQLLGNVDYGGLGLRMHTKLYPTRGKPLAWLTKDEYDLTSADVKRGIRDSLAALKTDSVDLWYLHGPDRNTPLVDTLAEVDAQYRAGKFKRFGVSNVYAWEVAAMCEICEAHGWIKPTVYQGVYNALHRAVEPELIACMRKYGIALYAFQPLAGGWLSGRFQRHTIDTDTVGTRLDRKTKFGAMLQARFNNEATFDALEEIEGALEPHGIPMAQAAQRWIMHHSKLEARYGDAVIVGASSRKHLEENLDGLEQGPLPDDVVEGFTRAHLLCRANYPAYWH